MDACLRGNDIKRSFLNFGFIIMDCGMKELPVPVRPTRQL